MTTKGRSGRQVLRSARTVAGMIVGLAAVLGLGCEAGADDAGEEPIVPAGAVGGPCTDDADCDAGLCLGPDGVTESGPYPGGYCSATCDPAETGACGAGAACYDFEEEDGLCARTCASDADCRGSGYVCVGVCLPSRVVAPLDLPGTLSGAEAGPAAVLDALDPDRVLARIRILAGEDPFEAPDGPVSIASRHPAHPDHALAVDYLREALAGLGLDVQEVEGAEGRITLWAELPGTDATLAPALLVAHYDSISEDEGVDEAVDPAPGANDNASGVAIALEIVAALSAEGVPSAPRTVRVVLTDAEEEGYFGAADYVASMTGEDDIACALVIDMLGGAPAATAGRFWYFYEPGSLAFAALGAEAVATFVDEARPIPAAREGELGTDSEPFWSAGFCSVSMFAWPYPPGTHSADDRVSALQPGYLATSTRAAAAVAAAWAFVTP